MRKRKPTPVSMFVGLSLISLPLMAAEDDTLDAPCETSNSVWEAYVDEKNDRFFFYEIGSGAPNSKILFEYWNDDKKTWSAEGTTNCYQGVPRCHLKLPYLVDGEKGGEIKAEINYVTSRNGEEMVVFSHLDEKIIYLFFKELPGRDVRLVGESFNGHEYPREDAMVIPSTFHKTPC